LHFIIHSNESFNAVINCTPPNLIDRSNDLFQSTISPNDCLRVISSGGCLIFGLPENIWIEYDVTNRLLEFEKKIDLNERAKCMSIQKISINIKDFPLYKRDNKYNNSHNNNDNSNDNDEIFKMTIAVLKKL
jgi:hypothetical protein